MKTTIRIYFIIVVFGLFFFSFMTNAQDTLKISLTEPLKDRPIKAGDYVGISISGMIPKIKYKITLDQSERLPAAPSLTPTNTPTTACEKYTAALNKYDDFITESFENKTEEKYYEIIGEINKVLKDTCENDIQVNTAKSIVSKYTFFQPYKFTLSLSEDLTITVIRRNENDSEDYKKWVFNFKTRDRGKFLVTYGFAFAPKVWEPSKYYTKELAADSFCITKQTAPGKLEFTFLPTIFFNWLPSYQANRTFSWSLTGGIGANTDNFAVLAGGSVMYNQTIGLSLGITFYNQKRLLGQYSENDIVKTNLTDDQLYQTIIGMNGYIAIIFRLSESPFKKPSD
jgi:hypothetical protein